MKALWVGLMVLAVAAPASADIADVLKTKHDTAKNSVGNLRAVADAKVAGPVNVPGLSSPDRGAAAADAKGVQEALKAIAQNLRAVADAKVAGPTIVNAVVDAKAQAKSRAVKTRAILDLNAPKSSK